MRYRKWFLLGMFLVGVFAPAISSVHAQTITKFDVPGAIATFPTSINPAGVITGSYFDSGSIMHRFVRDASGAITSFDPPGSSFIPTSTISSPTSINPAGEITGSYTDSSLQERGFVRDASGAFTSFDPPGSFSTDPTSINPAGEITGFYHDFFDARVAHGFVRSR